MLLQTILNRIQKQPGFVYGAVRFVPVRDRPGLEIELRGRRKRRPRCSGCQQPGPGYDTLPPRRFEFVPLWGLLVVFVYALRRVQCPRCGVARFLIVEVLPAVAVPWELAGHARSP